MPFPRVDKYDQLIAQLAEKHSRAADVWREFQQIAAERGWRDVPAERTVKRRVAEFQKLPQDDRLLNAPFRWPTSMRNGVVPWEASAAALDLLRVRDEMGAPRPVNREVLWFWWLTMARPDLDESDRAALSATMARDEFAELLTGPEYNTPYDEPLEWYLAYAPWQGPNNRASYRQAMRRGASPIPRSDEGGLLWWRGRGPEFLYPFEMWAKGAEENMKALLAEEGK